MSASHPIVAGLTYKRYMTVYAGDQAHLPAVGAIGDVVFTDTWLQHTCKVVSLDVTYAQYTVEISPIGTKTKLPQE